MIIVHALNGSPARHATPTTALATLADMLGHDVQTSLGGK